MLAIGLLFLVAFGSGLRVGNSTTYWIPYALLAMIFALFSLIWQSLNHWPGFFAPAYAQVLAMWVAAMVGGIVIGTIARWGLNRKSS